LTLHDAERRLDLLDHAAAPVARFAFPLFGSGDFLHPAIRYFLGHSGVTFLKTDIYGNLDVFTALCAFSSRSSAESAAENTAHKVADIEISKIKISLTFESALASEPSEIFSVESSKTSLPIGIILAFFLLVADDLIRFVYFLEPLFISTSIRMILDCSLFERFFDLFRRSVFFDS